MTVLPRALLPHALCSLAQVKAQAEAMRQLPQRLVRAVRGALGGDEDG